MIVTTQLTEVDFVQASLLGMRKRSRLRRVLQLIFPLFALLLLFFAWSFTLLGQSWSSQWPLLSLAALLVALPQLLYPLLFRRMFRRTSLLSEPRTFSFDETGVRISGSAYDSKTTWQVFSKFAEDKHAFVLFQQGNYVFLPISKRTLSEQQVTDLRDLLGKHLPAA